MDSGVMAGVLVLSVVGGYAVYLLLTLMWHAKELCGVTTTYYRARLRVLNKRNKVKNGVSESGD